MTLPNIASQRGESEGQALTRRRLSFTRLTLLYLRSKPLGTAGLLMVLIVAVVAIFAAVIAPFDYQAQNYEAVRTSPNTNLPVRHGPVRARRISPGWCTGRVSRSSSGYSPCWPAREWAR